MAQLAVVLLALFGQMERTYTLQRAAHARAVATAKGRRVGRPVTVDRAQLDYAAHLRTAGRTIARSSPRPIPRTSLYRHLPPRPPSRSPPASFPPPQAAEPQIVSRIGHLLRESSPNQAYGTPLEADTA